MAPRPVEYVPPAPEIRLLVEGYYIYSHGFAVEAILPNGGLDVVLGLELHCLRGPAYAPTHFLHGLTRTTFIPPPHQEIRALVIRFLPGGIAPFLEHEASTVSGTVTPLVSLSKLAPLLRLARGPAAETADRIPEVDEYLCNVFDRAGVSSPLRDILAVTQELAASQLVYSPRTLSKILGVQPRRLQRMMRRYFGIDAQTYCALQRLERCLAWQRRTGATWAEAAAEKGYADQSHLIRASRVLTGYSPGRLAKGISSGTLHARWAHPSSQ